MSTVKISVLIITFNEEKNIRRCLESVQSIADEIIVVDSFSTDKTEAICKEFNVRFVKNEFKGHIEQKNFALGLSANKHVLSLDADEALSEELIQSIIRLKSTWDKDAYSMNRLTNYCGAWIRHGSWYPDTKIRLITVGKGSWGGVNPHDEFLPDRHSSIGKVKGDILHYSYYTAEDHIAQVNKFTTLGAHSAFAAGKRANVLMLLYKPFYKFVRDYFLKLGFLDGYSGFVIARISAHATFLKYLKLLALQKK
ncbi:MAG TPA: glycosyltransferase family 2 protein [Bacteroidia bacterium]|nr:glycosyltransferase family 2 protein [Bacteroidia bacterium]HNS11418.1 glycosyltransferase family 2 protein [Bacteroidia bacterium]